MTTISCEKKEENKVPTISFLKPESDLIISKDTLIWFIAEPYDEDWTIDRVEFIKNGTIIQTVIGLPYEFDWNISSEDEVGVYSIKATAYDNRGAKGEAEIQIEIKSYLSKWLGAYGGTSYHWRTDSVSQEGPLITIDYYREVVVNVSKSS